MPGAILIALAPFPMPIKPVPRKSVYCGRFAPSPSGPLHLGSLICALASYLDARAHKGRWLLRIEDIDPPREEPGASDSIALCLQAHGLHWDDEIRYQSHRNAAYEQALARMTQAGLSYFCDCTRRRLSPLGGKYDGHCRQRNLTVPPAAALRLNTDRACGTSRRVEFKDRIQGRQHEDFDKTGDFIIHRKDGLFAYQLAVSVDDLDQGITDVVRGADLLDTTAKQVLVMRVLDGLAPRYAHIPVLVDPQGRKLSKQNHAPALDNTRAAENLRLACRALSIELPRHLHDTDKMLEWAIPRWQPEALCGQKEIAIDQLN